MPLYSEEIQDIMGRIPGRILKMGLTVLFGIIFLLLLGSYFFKYPEVVSCPIVLTTINPPLELYAQSSGKIEQLYVKEHEWVCAGQLIAVIENTADIRDALVLGRELDLLDGVVVWDSLVIQKEQKGRLRVGEVQGSYLRFCKSWMGFRHYMSQRYLPLKIGLLDVQIRKQKEYCSRLYEQRTLKEHDFRLAEKQFLRDSAFFRKYEEAVSLVDYEKQTQAFLQQKSLYMSFCFSVAEAENNVLKLNESRIDLEIRYEQELTGFRQELEESFRLLKEAYNQWKEKYVVVSSVEGRITFTGYWSENQVIPSGSRLATVVPEGQTEIRGRAVVDMRGIGRVEKGQVAYIKLHGFPYMNFGMLKGYVNSVSLVPEKEQGYIAEIRLERGMESSYRKHLSFSQQMEGTVEIMTKDERLLTRLISPLKFKLSE